MKGGELMSVKLVKNGQSFDYKSLNDACLQNGSTYGRNTTNAVKYLSSVGFDMSGFQNITTTRTTTSNGIVDRLVKMLSVVDNVKVADLTAKLNAVISGELNDKTLKTAKSLQEQIKTASMPTEPTLEAILNKVKELYADWSKE
jgi:hypothetical protein